jgi:hypothetical protein
VGPIIGHSSTETVSPHRKKRCCFIRHAQQKQSDAACNEGCFKIARFCEIAYIRKAITRTACIYVNKYVTVAINNPVHTSLALQPYVGPEVHFWFPDQFLAYGRTPWTSDRSVARPLSAQNNTTYRDQRKTSMPSAGFEPATHCTCVQGPCLGPRGFWLG